MIISDCNPLERFTSRQSLRAYEIFSRPTSTTVYFPEIIIAVRSQFVSLKLKKVTSFAQNPQFLEVWCG